MFYSKEDGVDRLNPTKLPLDSPRNCCFHLLNLQICYLSSTSVLENVGVCAWLSFFQNLTLFKSKVTSSPKHEKVHAAENLRDKYKQTVQIQIRNCRMRHLLRVYTVYNSCSIVLTLVLLNPDMPCLCK